MPLKWRVPLYGKSHCGHLWPILLFTIEILFIRDGHWFYFYGLLSTVVIPPFGIALSIRSYDVTDSAKDLLLITCNALALFSYFIYTF